MAWAWKEARRILIRRERNLGRRIQQDQRCIPLNYPALFMHEYQGCEMPICDMPQWWSVKRGYDMDVTMWMWMRCQGCECEHVCLTGPMVCGRKQGESRSREQGGSRRTRNSVGPKIHSLKLSCSIYTWVQDCEMPMLWYCPRMCGRTTIVNHAYRCEGAPYSLLCSHWLHGEILDLYEFLLVVCGTRTQLWACGKIEINGGWIQQDQRCISLG
jgi:hypothetical protein